MTDGSDTARTGAAGNDPETRKTRNSTETREKILQSAIGEFCAHGYAGANTTRIVRAAGCNIRMLYHYFENKDGLYRAALERVYAELRSSEEETNFWSLPPREGVVALTHFTFDYMRSNPKFPKMIINENINMGRAVREAPSVGASSRPFIARIDALIAQGHATGVFARRPEAVQLYLTILALGFIHISNAWTLAATFGIDPGSDSFLTDRRAHVTEVVLGYLMAPPAA